MTAHQMNGNNIELLQQKISQVTVSAPFFPSEQYPEWLNMPVSEEDNPAFRAVCKLFLHLGLDSANYSHPNWNPLKPISGSRNAASHTLLNDLSLLRDELWNGMCKTNRRHIQRADTKDGLSYKILTQPTVQDYAVFADFFRIFVTQRGLLDFQSNTHAALRWYLANGNLTLTQAGKDNETLVWHSYFVQGNQCRILYSASHFRGSSENAFKYLVGRYNRWFHWQDMLYFQAQGITVLDRVGWHVGADTVRLRANQFKERFGGKPVQVYDARYGITLRSHLENTIVRLVHQ
jgi:hypothetical protein